MNWELDRLTLPMSTCLNCGQLVWKDSGFGWRDAERRWGCTVRPVSGFGQMSHKVSEGVPDMHDQQAVLQWLAS